MSRRATLGALALLAALACGAPASAQELYGSGLPAPFIEGDCLVVVSGKPVWSSCAGAAGMDTSASNAVLPTARTNLGLGTTDGVRFGGLAAGGALLAGSTNAIYGGANQYALRIIDADGTSGTGYFFTGGGYYSYVNSGGQGAAIVAGYRGASASGSPGTQAGHFAFRLLDSASNEDTIAATYGRVLDNTFGAMKSRISLGWMNSVDATGGNAQPNEFIHIDHAGGMQLPGIPITGVSRLTAGGATSTPSIVAQSTGAFDSLIQVDNAAGGHQSGLIYTDAGTSKWFLGKNTDNSWLCYDYVNSLNCYTISTAGDTTVGEVGKKTAINGLITTAATKTANYSVVAGDTGKHFDNIGAAGEVDFTLPAAASGLQYCFLVDAAQTVKVIAASGEKIAIGASNSAATGNITATAAFAMTCLEAHKAAQWVARSSTGTWTVN